MWEILEIFSVLFPVLISVAYITIVERKELGYLQRRVGPNEVGYYGLLQPFADAIKLIIKEEILPYQSDKIVFVVSPILSLFFSLVNWGIIEYGEGLTIYDSKYGILYSLSVSSLGVYGVLFAGWSANSKYAFIGSLRASAQMISYELVYSCSIILSCLYSGSYSINILVWNQECCWTIYPELPVFLFYIISSLAETNRVPFDLIEAESELVSGFMTEHSSVVFVFFFLAEYSSIVFISTLSILLFLGGYNLPDISIPTNWINFSSITLGLKSAWIMFLWIWVRGTLPRLRWDSLMICCWTVLLPLVLGFLLLEVSLSLSKGVIIQW